MNAQSNEETKREVKLIWNMFKKDPLSPLNAYCSRYVITGMGMFTEGYVIFVSTDRGRCRVASRSCDCIRGCI